jgi:sigma54-dependent transcription regulator
VGDPKPRKANVRVIAATNRNLKDAWLRKGKFREDLYYRLNVISITLPPLRERPLDLDCQPCQAASQAFSPRQRGGRSRTGTHRAASFCPQIEAADLGALSPGPATCASCATSSSAPSSSASSAAILAAGNARP